MASCGIDLTKRVLLLQEQQEQQQQNKIQLTLSAKKDTSWTGPNCSSLRGVRPALLRSNSLRSNERKLFTA